MATPDPHVRISNAEREAVIGRLHAATEEGRLELDEFAERSRQVYEAKTFAEVEHLLTDLPKTGGALAVPIGGAAESAVPDLELTHAYTKVRKEGAWKVPARITVRPQYGRTVLDFRHAQFTSRETEIELDLQYSGLVVILPRGATAVDDNVQPHGGRVVNGSRASGDGPAVRLTGSIHYARVKVRYERRFLWWRW
ncbi:DUF1707 SHOCT-like domain-containing protein [Glycomyces algeriensis]|uniref:DUF1707 domain-containing protein n=1 Tax=Glycomyces algeriensis TaxID=256037 RepID=A0A9W6G733_9ACTN|nr:DUF1707 domain-containing protein [Glycomyces algeriensis]MDA1368182.1 DUF1707 domain-containing protein [Glycomyces algeriensis]MDR7348834.1 hypothetical protein [Glycomyces algeriensis]GLI41537.1 hypothetical protein GALLR39Z86_13870 [Glycomyces algeriensis]